MAGAFTKLSLTLYRAITPALDGKLKLNMRSSQQWEQRKPSGRTSTPATFSPSTAPLKGHHYATHPHGISYHRKQGFIVIVDWQLKTLFKIESHSPLVSGVGQWPVHGYQIRGVLIERVVQPALVHQFLRFHAHVRRHDEGPTHFAGRVQIGWRLNHVLSWNQGKVVEFMVWCNIWSAK